jgi:hypothetical protein
MPSRSCADLEAAFGKLLSLIGELESRFAGVTEEQAAEPALRGGWSRKQLAGHLVDSASNNHQRFVRALLLGEGELAFPAYEQNGWVDAGNYAAAPWSALAAVCVNYNRLLYGLMNVASEEALESVRCRVGSGEPVTLSALFIDYVRHLEHHATQLRRD